MTQTRPTTTGTVKCSTKGCSKRTAPRRVPVHLALCPEHMAAQIKTIENLLRLARADGNSEESAMTSAAIAMKAKGKLGLRFSPTSPIITHAESIYLAVPESDEPTRRKRALDLARAAMASQLVPVEQPDPPTETDAPPIGFHNPPDPGWWHFHNPPDRSHRSIDGRVYPAEMPDDIIEQGLGMLGQAIDQIIPRDVRGKIASQMRTLFREIGDLGREPKKKPRAPRVEKTKRRVKGKPQRAARRAKP